MTKGHSVVDGERAVDLVESAIDAYRQSFPEKGKPTISDSVLVLSTLDALKANGMVVVDRERFERLRIAAGWANALQGSTMLDFTVHLEPGDLDPIP